MSEMTVVVGVEGSPSARAALEFAMDEAILRRSRLRMIAVVQPPESGITSLASLVPPPPDELVDDVRKTTQEHVDQLVAARTDIAGGLPISVEARAGRPGHVLCDAAASAESINSENSRTELSSTPMDRNPWRMASSDPPGKAF